MAPGRRRCRWRGWPARRDGSWASTSRSASSPRDAQEASRQGLKAEFRSGDLADLHEEGSYDLVYTRFLLSRRPRDQAEDELRRMMHVVQPGGTIVVEDLECSPEADGPMVDHPAYTRFLELFNALVRDEEADRPEGLHLPELLEQAGVAGVSCNDVSRADRGRRRGAQPGVARPGLDPSRHRRGAARDANRGGPPRRRARRLPDRPAKPVLAAQDHSGLGQRPGDGEWIVSECPRSARGEAGGSPSLPSASLFEEDARGYTGLGQQRDPALLTSSFHGQQA